MKHIHIHILFIQDKGKKRKEEMEGGRVNNAKRQRICFYCYFRHFRYPVILSLENHCSIEKQKTMAKHLETILGGIFSCLQISAAQCSAVQ